jgi:hypothetical protein
VLFFLQLNYSDCSASSGWAGSAGVAGGGGGGGGDVVSAAASGLSSGVSAGAVIFLQPMLNAMHNPTAAINATKRFIVSPLSPQWGKSLFFT